jgi:hypothetical protein
MFGLFAFEGLDGRSVTSQGCENKIFGGQT